MSSITPGVPQMMLEPAQSRRLVKTISQQMERMLALGYPQPVLICMAALRLPLRRLTERTMSQLVILSYNEIVPNTEVRATGQVTDNELQTA